MGMTGRHEDGIECSRPLSKWARSTVSMSRGTLRYLEREDFGKVLTSTIRVPRGTGDDHIDIANAVSMLGRPEMRGVVCRRWEELGEVCARRADDRLYVFHMPRYRHGCGGTHR